MSDWQLIETAPKDGTEIVGAKKSSWNTLSPFPYPLKVKWDGECWRANDGGRYDPQPSHWMPIPEPPAL